MHPAADLQGHLPAAPPLDALQGAFQLGAELVVADRLEHEIQRVDLVPADGILGHVGDEDQHDLGVKLADALGRGHTAQAGHLNIQKDDVKAGAIRLHDLGAIRERGHIQLATALLRVLCDKPAQFFPHGGVILDYGDLCHGAVPFPLHIYVL